jgi:hypothetical protein
VEDPSSSSPVTLLHHAVCNKETSGIMPCVVFVFISQITRDSPGVNFPVTKTFLNSVPNGALRKNKL